MSGVGAMVLALVGFAISWLSIPLIQKYLHPSSRRQLHHTHTAPICRFGGLAIAVPFLVAAAVAFVFYPVSGARTYERWVIVGSSVAMFVLGFIDDAWPLGAKRKLIGQVLIALAVYYGGIHIGQIRNPITGTEYILGPWSCLATVLWLVAFTNLINLIDGVDGLAGGISLMVMGLLLYVGFGSELVFPVACAAGVCGALIGFLYYNFPPARIYLGDGGAYFLGFLIGLLSMVHSHKGSVAAALIAPLFALALPIVDVALSIVRRGIHGVPIFRPDRRHLHHRLAETGWSRTRIVLMFYGCSLFFLLLAFLVLMSQGRWVPLLFGVLCVVLLVSARSFSFSREWFAIGRVLGNSLETRKQTRYALTLGRWLELEGERAGSPEDLWADFGFILKKLGFSAATLSTPHGRKHWRAVGGQPGHTGGSVTRMHCNLSHESTLHFVAPVSVMEGQTLQLLSELAAETWVKATARWEQSHTAPFAFLHLRPASRQPGPAVLGLTMDNV
jgi:UDP-GlcNAc:undecaprenyl-phosphate GlcNAc-1-phosphate transferase